jgi:hypothetical protein
MVAMAASDPRHPLRGHARQALLNDAAVPTLSCAAALAGRIEAFAALPFVNFPVFAGGYQHVVELHAGDK